MKRIITIIALSVLTGCSLFKGNEDPNTTKILVIGNSFSVTTLKHLPRVAQDRGVDLDLASLYIGGCSLKRHWENAKKENPDFKPYRYDRIVKGVKTVDGIKKNLPEVLAESAWNIITVQQSSYDSWKPETYEPYGGNLIGLIRELAPQARIYVQETWSYTPFDPRLKRWGLNQDEMYAKLKSAYSDFATKYGLETICMGTAIQEWRKRLPVVYADNSFGGDVVGGRYQKKSDQFKRNVQNKWELNGDAYHLNEDGEYFQALVWAAKLFNVDLEDLEYRPETIPEERARLMRNVAADLKAMK